MRNNSLKEIWIELEKAKTVLLFPHVLMDGDSLGSSVALCIALRKKGKECYILIEDSVPAYLEFIAKDYCISDQTVLEDLDVSICLDCGTYDRIEKRKEKFDTAKITICIDHHRTSEPFLDMNYIAPKASSTAEIIFEMLESNDVKINKEMAEAIFAGVITDTGNFQYENTTKKTHEIAMKLYDIGINSEYICTEIYENVTIERLILQAKVLDRMKVFADGKGAIAHVSKKTLKDANAKMEDTEGLVVLLRSIKGVEISALVKQYSNKVCKVALRSKHYGDVSKIAAKYNGGGHKKAAGCTIELGIEATKKLMMKEIEEELQRSKKEKKSK
ncbi:MAG: DHH family phosphoesterase [Anaerovoracaceae bacterium]